MTKVKKTDEDPLQEIRAYRDAVAKKFNYDARALVKNIQKREKKEKRKFADLPVQPLKKSS